MATISERRAKIPARLFSITSMMGYQEVLTDPSYHRQIVTMTYPLIGNYGINPEDFESEKPFVAGFVIKEYCPYPSNFRLTETLHDFLSRYRIIGIEGIDTRELVRIIRQTGAMRGVISTIDSDPVSLLKKSPVSTSYGGSRPGQRGYLQRAILYC